MPRPDQAPYEDDSRIDIARRMLDARDYRMAEQVMRTVLLQNGNVDRARFYLALATHKQKRYAQARPIFECVLETRQGFPEVDHVFHFYGWCLYNLGELDAARGAFEEHLRRVPTEGDSVYGLGLIALEEDRLDDAEASFRRAIELQIDLPSRRIDVAKAHARLGDVQLRRNEVEAARGSYTEAVRLWPDHYEVWAKLSRVHARLGNETAAESALAEHDAAKRRVGRAPASEAAEDASNEERDEPAVDDSAPPG